MGSLKLPAGGLIYLDTNGFIYSVERIVPYYQLLIPLWEAAKAQQFEVVSSELALLECLVKPLALILGTQGVTRFSCDPLFRAVT